MPSAFVPFLSSGGKTAASAALAAGGLAESAQAASSFAALLPGTGAPGVSVRTAAVCAHGPQGGTGQPTVTLQRDGDRVTHIRIQCTCGEVIELECVY